MRTELKGPGSSKDHILQIHQGGTSGENNEQALRNLGALNRDHIGQPNGVVGYLPGTTEIPEIHFPGVIGSSLAITIEGPQSLAVGESILLKITNFDSFTTYTLQTKSVSATIEDDTIMVTGQLVDNEAFVQVNDSVFPLNVTFGGQVFRGDTLGNFALNAVASGLALSGNSLFALVASKGFGFGGSTNAGRVTLLGISSGGALSAIRQLSPELLTTTITYSGQGTKSFTVNNQTTVRTDSGTISFTGAGNIIIEGTGDVVTVPGTPQQGNPSFPSGLPPYRAAYTGLDFSGSTSVSWKGFDFPITVTSISSFGPVPEGLFISVDTVGANIVATGNSTGRFTSTSNYGGSWSTSAVSIVGTLRDGFAVIDPATWGAPEISANVSVPGSGSTTSYDQQGDPSFPSGLPPYVPGTPGGTFQDTLTFTSDNFQISGQNVNQLVYPFQNYTVGESYALAENGTFVTGFTRTNAPRITTGGEVLINFLNGVTSTLQRITAPVETPHPRFGAAVALTTNASRLLVGAPAANRVHHYTLSGGNFAQVSVLTPAGLPPGARFGEVIATNADFSRIYIAAPGQGAGGFIHIYSVSGINLNFIESIDVASMFPGRSFGTLIQTVQSMDRLFFNLKDSNNVFSVAEIRRSLGTWTMYRVFETPVPGVPDGFAEHFDVSAGGDRLYIGAPGDDTIRGQLHMWLYLSDVWYFYDQFVEDNGNLGDLFSSFVATNLFGTGVVTIRKDGSNHRVLYLE